MARRAASELEPGQVVVLGSGLPMVVAAALPPNSPVQLLSDGGALGYAPVSDGARSTGPTLSGADGRPVGLRPGGAVVGMVDWAAMLRGRHVDTAVLQPARVTSSGDFIGWSTAATPGLFAPGGSVDLADGCGKVVAMLLHTGSDGSPNIVAESSPVADGRGCVNLIITDLAVIRVADDGLVLAEVAPGWSYDDVATLTGAPLASAGDLKDISPNLAALNAGPPNKVFPDGPSAIADLPDGATVMVDGFGGPGGMAHHLLVSLRDRGTKGLTIISNTIGIARIVNFGTPAGRLAIDHTILVENGQVAKAIASYPVSPSASRPSAFELAYRRGDVELELVPQGTLAERLRAGGAGIHAFYTPTGAGTLIAEGKESRVIDGKEYILEEALKADFCLIRGHKADTLGNVVYKGTSRNFNAVMAPAADVTVIEVDEIVEPGELDPELIVTPGIYVDRIVKRPEGFSPYE
jgi:3-oxoacid CoA-transferase subunit A